MMLLIGMKISFTKKPMKPMMKKPTDVAWAIFENSAQRRAQHVLRAAGRAQGGAGEEESNGSDRGHCWLWPGWMRQETWPLRPLSSGQPGPGLQHAPFLSGFVQRFIRRQLSRMNSMVGFLTYSMASADMPTCAATALSASRLSRRAAQRVGLASAPGLRRHVASPGSSSLRGAARELWPIRSHESACLGRGATAGRSSADPARLARQTRPWGTTTIFQAAGRP